MYFLRQFDPWSGKFCTCKPKYSLAPYTGCDHRCLYCYITTYIPNAFSPRPKKDFIKKLASDLDKADNSLPISIANSSDPYPTIEKKHRLTRETLKLLADLNYKTLLVTKSDIFLRDLDILANGKFAFSLTISTNDDELATKLEPGAPPPSKRILAAAKLIENSVPVGIRVDPIIPGLNEDVEPLLKQLAEVGVECITSSTYKARTDSIKRLIEAFPKQKSRWEKLYLDDGQYFNRSWYLPADERQRILQNVSQSAKKHGLKFNMCREGLSIIRTAPSCDGMHLLSSIM